MITSLLSLILVSIPYRRAKNKIIQFLLQIYKEVSIPYRRAKNEIIEKMQEKPFDPFQSLIGELKTNIAGLVKNQASEFQSLIGELKTNKEINNRVR